MSLDRLIRLAKRTGDRLIVHDPVQGRDIVLLDIDEYEQLMFGTDFFGAPQPSEPPSPHDEDDGAAESNGDEWESTGSILRDRYGDWGEEEKAHAKGESASLIDDMWGAAPEEAMHDAALERKTEAPVPFVPETADDEPIFYEEPLA